MGFVDWTKAFCKRQNWEDFAMNFFSVFLGIVLTFGGEAIIDEYREDKEVCEALRLVSNELKDNVQQYDAYIENMQFENRAAIFLMQYYDNYDACDVDTLYKYCNAPLTKFSFDSSEEALELLKTSSLFQKIEDKDLALNIIRVYTLVRSVKESVEFYGEKKVKLIDKAMNEEATKLFARNNFTAQEMWTALTSSDNGRQFVHEVQISTSSALSQEGIKEFLEEVIKQIEEYITEN